MDRVSQVYKKKLDSGLLFYSGIILDHKGKQSQKHYTPTLN